MCKILEGLHRSFEHFHLQWQNLLRELCLLLTLSSKYFEFKYPLPMKVSTCFERFNEIFIASIKYVMKHVGDQNQVDSQIWSTPQADEGP